MPDLIPCQGVVVSESGEEIYRCDEPRSLMECVGADGRVACFCGLHASEFLDSGTAGYYRCAEDDTIGVVYTHKGSKLTLI